MVSYMRPTDF